MRKIILLAFIGVFIGSNASAWTQWRFGKNDRCVLEEYGWYLKNQFYFCGSQTAWCQGLNSQNGQNHWYGNGDSVKLNGKLYWCCGGTGSGSASDNKGAGSFVAGDSWIKDSKMITKQLGNGRKCTYQKITTICGKEVNPGCTEPDECPDGMMEHPTTKRCITACSGGMLLENDSGSAPCVKCERTAYQGPAKDSLVCAKCDPTTQFYDSKKKECVNKSDLTAYYNQVMKKCFACPSDAIFKECMNHFNLPSATRPNGPRSFFSDCLIKDNNL